MYYNIFFDRLQDAQKIYDNCVSLFVLVWNDIQISDGLFNQKLCEQIFCRHSSKYLRHCHLLYVYWTIYLKLSWCFLSFFFFISSNSRWVFQRLFLICIKCNCNSFSILANSINSIQEFQSEVISNFHPGRFGDKFVYNIHGINGNNCVLIYLCFRLQTSTFTHDFID